MKAIITVGVSGSGKSTFAKELCENDVTFAEVNRNNIREELFGDNYKQTKEKELTVSFITFTNFVGSGRTIIT